MPGGTKSKKMELTELRKVIDNALQECEEKLEEQPEIVLSESDFERLVAWSLMKQLGHSDYKEPQPNEFTVHTQVSHYLNDSKPNRRVDILLLTEEGRKKAKTHKEYKYYGDSFALELKYIRKNDSINGVRYDICKRFDLDSDSWLYVVALIDTNNDDEFLRKEQEIEGMKDRFVGRHPEYANKLFCKAIRVAEKVLPNKND